MKKYLISSTIIFLFVFLNSFVFSEEKNNKWSSNVFPSIEDSHSSKVETVGLKQVLVVINFSQDGIDAAIEMWRRNERDFLELVWWRQYDRTIRTVILSLFYTQSKMTTSNAPDFDGYLRKFSDDERIQRSEELNFVKKNKKQFSEILNRIISEGNE